MNFLKRRSVIFVISDFIDQEYLHSLKGMARKHDLIVIKLYDQRETLFPKVGIVPLYENETQRNIWVNSSSSKFREIMDQTHQDKAVALEDFCSRNDANYLSLSTQEDYVPQLLKLFTRRNKKSSQRAR